MKSENGFLPADRLRKELRERGMVSPANMDAAKAMLDHLAAGSARALSESRKKPGK